MNKKRLLIAIGINFVVAMMVIGLLGIKDVFPQECRIIKIHGETEQGPLALEPETAFLSKGDCVVWFNLFTAPNVFVTLEEGKRCVGATKGNAEEWSLTGQNCYVSRWIPSGGIVSLWFMEKGTYKYRTEAKDSPGIKAEGQIVVK